MYEHSHNSEPIQEPRMVQCNCGGTHACMVEDSTTHLHQQSKVDKYNTFSCNREHETHRETQS